MIKNCIIIVNERGEDMRKYYLGLIYLSLFLLFVSAPIFATSHIEIVRVKIGIQIEHASNKRIARRYEKAMAGDILNICVIPESGNGYIYIVYSDQKSVELLNKESCNNIFTAGELFKIPKNSDGYQIDGLSNKEYFAIICSSEKRDDIVNFLNKNGTSLSKWKQYLKKIKQKCKIDISQSTEKPATIAGNIRGFTDFSKSLTRSTGNTMVVKEYEFRVKQKNL